jgi:WD40 repeat protein
LVVTEGAQRWNADGRKFTTDLLSGWQLHDARSFKGLSKLEQDYLDESQRYVDADQSARNRNKFILIGLAVFVLVAVIFLVDGLTLLVKSQTDRDRSQVLEQFARATESSYRGQVDDALTAALQAGFKMAALPNKMRDGLRPQLREAMLSTLRNATNLKRLFIVQDYGIVKDDVTANAVTFNAVAFHPTRADDLIAFGGSNGLIYLTSLGHGGALFPPTLKACVDDQGGSSLADQGVSSLAFDPDGRLLVVGCRGGKLAVWSTENWHLIGSPRSVSSNFIRSLSIRRDGRLVAATAGAKIALVQLDETGEPSKDPVTFATGQPALGGTVQSLAFSPAGDTLVAGDGEGYILICRPAGPKPWDCAYPEKFQAVPNDAILTFTYSSDGQQVAVGHYWRGVVDIWDANFSSGSRRTIDHQSPSAVYSLAFFEACGRRQLAIATNSGLEYSPLDERAPGDKPVDYCARARWAQIGDQTYSVAFRDGLLAAATQAGYVAVLAPAGGEDPLRTRVPMRTNPASRDPIRGALLDEAESIVWLALQYNPADADPAIGVWTTASKPDPSHNVAILELSERGGKNILTFKAGNGESEAGRRKIITRLAASRTPLSKGQALRRLVTIGCTKLQNAEDCSDDDYEVTVSQFGDRLDAPPTGLVSLTTPDFKSKVPPETRIPWRAILSPDGQWLAISFKGNLPDKQLLFVPLDRPGERIWIDSSVKRIKEIAFSEDGKTFAVGGCCGEAGLDLIRLWSVDKSVWTPKETPKPLTLTPLAQGVQDVAFASSTLVVGGRSGAIDLWTPGAGTPSEVRVDTHGVSFVAFSRDEWLVAAASSQGVVRVWDTSNRPPFELTPAADDPATPGFLAFAGNGTRLISSADTIDVWDLDPGSLQRKACALLRQLDPKGINGDTPWHQNRECREGALTPAPRTYFQSVRNYLKRALVALGFVTARS